jgi:uncharacterized protein YndB with AHSA1/START domain
VAPMPGATSSSVEHEIRVDARPETVFAYFTDPARMVCWMGTEATLDPRPGGVCRIKMVRPLGEASILGRFVEVEPFSRIVFTGGWDMEAMGVPPESSRVEVSFEPHGSGTLVRLEHTRLAAQAVEDHVVGWRNYLGRLRVVAEGGDPGPDEFVAPSIAPPPAPEE